MVKEVNGSVRIIRDHAVESKKTVEHEKIVFQEGGHQTVERKVIYLRLKTINAYPSLRPSYVTITYT